MKSVSTIFAKHCSFKQKPCINTLTYLATGSPYFPTKEGVMNFLAYKYFQDVDPAKPEEINGFLRFMKEIRKVLTVNIQPG